VGFESIVLRECAEDVVVLREDGVMVAGLVELALGIVVIVGCIGVLMVMGASSTEGEAAYDMGFAIAMLGLAIGSASALDAQA
jgi:hypothetical protein